MMIIIIRIISTCARAGWPSSAAGNGSCRAHAGTGAGSGNCAPTGARPIPPTEPKVMTRPSESNTALHASHRCHTCHTRVTHVTHVSDVSHIIGRGALSHGNRCHIGYSGVT
jgi:hypothetical protein